MHTAQASQLQPPAGSNPMGLRKIETVPLHTSPLRSSSSCQLSSTSPKQGTSFPLLRSPRSPMTSASLRFLPSLFEIFLYHPLPIFPFCLSFYFCLRKNFPLLFLSSPHSHGTAPLTCIFTPPTPTLFYLQTRALCLL